MTQEMENEKHRERWRSRESADGIEWASKREIERERERGREREGKKKKKRERERIIIRNN